MKNHQLSNGSALVFTMLPLLASPAGAALLTWDTDPASTGAQSGAGTWTNGGTNWWDGDANVAWNNSTPDAAIFAGEAGGVVNLGTAITAAGLTFDTAGYSLTGGTITLNGATITTHQDATLSSQIVSNGFDGLADGATVAVGANQFTIAYHDANAVTLTAVVGGYADWAAANAPAGAPGDDFDGDGVPNAVEYILGGGKDTNDLGKLPTAQATGGDFVFSFVRSLVGTDLVSWPWSYNVATAPEVTTTANGDGTETVTLTITRAPDGKKFARLSVEIGS